jgi:adenosylcobinamide kinase / adenosylcobinamide-phosphate guanylyltransferase
LTAPRAPGLPATSLSHLVLGGARSGKSRYAVGLGRSWPGRVAFVATAEGRDAVLAARIARHRAERPAGWATLEEPLDLLAACRDAVSQADLVVVDCLTLWVANRMLGGDSDAAILGGAEDLAHFMDERRAALILISNEVGEGVHPPTADGLRYRDLMGQVNQRAAAAADRVTLMVAGIAVPIKVEPCAAPEPTGAHREQTQAP